MVESFASMNKKFKITILLGTDPECFTEIEIPRDLDPSYKMTALLYARDHLLQQVGLKEYQLMFDNVQPITEEKVLR